MENVYSRQGGKNAVFNVSITQLFPSALIMSDQQVIALLSDDGVADEAMSSKRRRSSNASRSAVSEEADTADITVLRQTIRRLEEEKAVRSSFVIRRTA